MDNRQSTIDDGKGIGELIPMAPSRTKRGGESNGVGKHQEPPIPPSLSKRRGWGMSSKKHRSKRDS